MPAALGLLAGAWEEATVNWSPRKLHFSENALPCPLSFCLFPNTVFRYGMGVDQVVEVELVGADGSLIVANGRWPKIWDKNYVASKGNGTRVTSADGLQTEESEDSGRCTMGYCRLCTA